MQRIGVFICWCGSNIAATVDVQRLSALIKAEPGVVYSADYQYMCSENGQQLIRNAIREYGLTGVVIGSCSPRMHEATFRKAAEAEGLNPYMVEVANIREQCSWIHKDKEEATAKALSVGFRGIKWTDIEVLHDENGKPYATLQNAALSRMRELTGKTVHVSISHIKQLAVAQAIVED